ncbi:MAG: alpha/beta hydrolase [Planctomycetes bacterium]|nr:alpha/beta hydrolase [Planctomycetota bacterium]
MKNRAVGCVPDEPIRVVAIACLFAAFSMTDPASCLGATDLAELAKAPAGQKYAYGKDPLQFGELTLPKGPGPHPVAVFIHGGCWLAQYDIAHSRALANALAEAGIAVWNLEYRRVGDSGGGWPGTFLDVASGADYLRTLAEKHPLDLSRVIAIGHSAGGHLALWLAARHKIPAESDIYRAKPIGVVGVLGLAPAPELDKLHEKEVCGHVIDKLMGGGPEKFPKRYRDASPSRMAPIGVAQIILVGDKDKSWGWVGEAYTKAARKAGDEKIELITAPGANHFEVIDPHSTTWPLVLGAARSLLGIK